MMRNCRINRPGSAGAGAITDSRRAATHGTMLPCVRLRASARSFGLVALLAGAGVALGCGNGETAGSTRGTGAGGGQGGQSGAGGGSTGGGGGMHAGLLVTPKVAKVATGGTVQFKADAAASWSVQESSGGTITSGGLYTAPGAKGTFHVVATSKADPNKQGEATVTVQATHHNPKLVPGKWVDITPPGLNLVCCPPSGNSFGLAFVEIDPSNPATLYATVDQLGLWKTTDAGENWHRLGDPNGTISDAATTYLDSPIRVGVDPGDPQHLYATQGVRGMTLGFWVSNDGGESWTKPQGFLDIAATIGTEDMTSMSIDPSDFKHLILGSHSAWSGLSNAGILESKDGGDSWRAIQPQSTWNAGSMGVSILSSPALGIGDGKTWLVGTDGNGFWRTNDAGQSWQQVSSQAGIPHGGNDIYYTATGILYAGAAQYPIRSHDNGASWEQVSTGLSYWYYYTVQGDGKRLYTQLSFTGDNGGQGLKPYMTSLESDGSTWTQYNDQTFSDGPFIMRFDAINRVMYSANWDAGLWALEVVDP
jgi:hypothetical protein